MLALPVLALISIAYTPDGSHWGFQALGYDLFLSKVDALSRVFGYIFCIVTFLGIIFALNIDDDLQFCAAYVYAGGALGVSFAGDVFSLYIFWEIMAVASTFLILARRTRAARTAAMRYMLVHIFGGLCLLAGIILYVQRTGSTSFGLMHLSGIDSYLIFFGIAVNAAIPPLHPWLSDAYPEATVDRGRFLERLYHQKRGLSHGQDVSWNRAPYLAGSRYDDNTDILCGTGERYPPGTGLQPHQPGRLYDVRYRDRNSPCHQRNRVSCLLPYPLQSASIHGGRFCPARYRENPLY